MIDREDINLLKNILGLTNKNVDFDLLYKVLTATKEFEHLKNDILDSFSNNQLKSKSRVLEIAIKNNFVNADSEVIVFGSWYGSILIPGLCDKVKHISCVDLDEQVLKIAKNRLFPNLDNIDYILGNVFDLDLKRYHTTDLFINTSCEHMPPMKEWPYWKNVKEGCHFVFTSNNMYDIQGHINCVDSMDNFKEQLPPNSKILFEDEIVDERGTRFLLAGMFS